METQNLDSETISFCFIHVLQSVPNFTLETLLSLSETMKINLAALDNNNIATIQIKEQINNKYNIYFHKIKGLRLQVLNSLMEMDV